MLEGMSQTQAEIFEALRLYVIERRHSLGISQVEAARRGGFPVGTLANFEGGSRASIPRQETLQAFAKGMAVPYATLYRFASGLTPEPSDADAVIANLVSDLSPEGKSLVLEWLTMPEERRLTVEAGLVALLAAIRRQSVGAPAFRE